MKTKMFVVAVCLMLISLIIGGCGNDKHICTPDKTCHTYGQYGLFNLDDKNPNIKYELVVGNVVWDIILFETVIVPVVLIGWKLYEPVGVISTDPNMKGVVK
jgi:hypothetical protein